MAIKGIHHITAITGDIQRNLDFYIGVLGLNLAKRTVIQEEPSTYHLFYGDGAGSVGTGLTFFDWPHVVQDRIGERNVVRTLAAVEDEQAYLWWRERFDRMGIAYTGQQDFAGRSALHFTDPEGQRLGIVVAGHFAGYQHWAMNAATEAMAIQAMHSVILGVDTLQPTVDFLTSVFGYEVNTTFHSVE